MRRRKSPMPLAFVVVAMGFRLYAQSTAHPVAPEAPAKKATTATKKTAPAKAPAESPEHAYARKELEQAKERLDALSGASNLYFRLTLALEPSTLCSFDHPNDRNHSWRDCHFNMGVASKAAFVSEDSLREAMTPFCRDIQPDEPASACYDKAEAMFNKVSKELKAIDPLSMMKRLDLVDPCLQVYRLTIDMKASDLTTRESEQIKACQSADLYPPEK